MASALIKQVTDCTGFSATCNNCGMKHKRCYNHQPLRSNYTKGYTVDIVLFTQMFFCLMLLIFNS